MKTCFFIGPIGDEGSQTRDWSDQVLNLIVAPVVTSFGYETPRRSDLIHNPGSISLEIIKRLVEDDLVIADLTDKNPNVFYELAIRHVTQKPVIHLIRQGDRIPFDVSDFRAISIGLTLSIAEKAKENLRKQIEMIETGGGVYTPLTQFRALKNALSNDSVEMESKETVQIFLEQIEDLRMIIGDLRKDVIDLRDLDRPRTTFTEKRLAKVELVRKQQEKTKSSGSRKSKSPKT